MAVPLTLFGLLVWLTARASNGAAPNPNGAAEWRSCPAWLHPFLRSDGGPVVVTAVAIELAGMVMAGAGVMRGIGLLDGAPWGTVAYYAIVAAWVVAFGIFVAVEVRARLQVRH